jgi:hypothetical protein
VPNGDDNRKKKEQDWGQMTDVLDSYLADISKRRRREFLGRYLSLDEESLFSILGDRLTFGLRDDWQAKSTSREVELAEKGRLWFDKARPKLQEALADVWADDLQPEDNIALVEAVMDAYKASGEEWPAPILILVIILVKEGSLKRG